MKGSGQGWGGVRCRLPVLLPPAFPKVFSHTAASCVPSSHIKMTSTLSVHCLRPVLHSRTFTVSLTGAPSASLGGERQADRMPTAAPTLSRPPSPHCRTGQPPALVQAAGAAAGGWHGHRWAPCPDQRPDAIRIGLGPHRAALRSSASPFHECQWRPARGRAAHPSLASLRPLPPPGALIGRRERAPPGRPARWPADSPVSHAEALLAEARLGWPVRAADRGPGRLFELNSREN